MSVPGVVKNSAVIQNGSGEPLECDIRYERGSGRTPVVVICHSFMSFKDWGFFPPAAERIAAAGYTTVTFNFSRNGVPPGGDRISDFASFASNSFSREIEDLGSVVEAVRDNRLAGETGDPGKVILLGHSRGGGIAASFASRDPDITALVTWSGIATFDRWTAHQKVLWRERGFLPLSASQGLSPLRIGRETLEDLDGRLGEIDPVLRAVYIRAPWLILHGKADVTVPVREAEALERAAGGGKAELRLLDAVGHLYNARSPEEDHYLTLNHVIAQTLGWLSAVPS